MKAYYDLSEDGILTIDSERHQEILEKSDGLLAFQKDVVDFKVESFSIAMSKKSGFPNITFYNASGESFRTHMFELIKITSDLKAKKNMLKELNLNIFKGKFFNRKKISNTETVVTFTKEAVVKVEKKEESEELVF